jgi:hypothetical protein
LIGNYFFEVEGKRPTNFTNGHEYETNEKGVVSASFYSWRFVRFVGNPLYQPEGLPSFFLTLHTFDESLDFHPDLHALVTEGLLDADGVQSAGTKVGLFLEAME